MAIMYFQNHGMPKTPYYLIQHAITNLMPANDIQILKLFS